LVIPIGDQLKETIFIAIYERFIERFWQIYFASDTSVKSYNTA
jgi:hypothetical protein